MQPNSVRQFIAVVDRINQRDGALPQARGGRHGSDRLVAVGDARASRSAEVLAILQARSLPCAKLSIGTLLNCASSHDTTAVLELILRCRSLKR